MDCAFLIFEIYKADCFAVTAKQLAYFVVKKEISHRIKEAIGGGVCKHYRNFLGIFKDESHRKRKSCTKSLPRK